MIYKDIKEINKTYNLILADPPWKQVKGGRKNVRPNSSGTVLDYPTLTLDEIKKQLNYIAEHTTDNAILFLWNLI